MPATSTETPDAARIGISVRRIAPQAQAFADGRALSREELLAAPLRWPRPQRLLQPLPLPLPRGKVAEGLRALGLVTVGDLLEHLPRDSREARTVADLRAGEQATVAVQVRAIPRARFAGGACARSWRRRSPTRRAAMRATFFNQPWLVERYPPGTRLLLHGKADARGGFRVSHHAPASGQASLGSAAEPLADDASPGGGAAVPAGASSPAPARERRGALPGDRGRQLDADPDARAAAPGSALCDVFEPLPAAHARAASGCPTARARSRRCTSRATRATPSAAASAWRSTSCC